MSNITSASSEFGSRKDSASPLRVVCVQEEMSIRESLREMVNNDPKLAMVGDFGSLSLAIKHLPRLNPDVIIIDICFLGLRSIDAIRELKDNLEHSRILIFTLSQENEDLFDALRAGVDGYLLKQASPKEIIKAIHAVCEGDFPMSPAMSRRMVDYLRPKISETAVQERLLTQRQIEILEQISRGLSAKEIASLLNLSVLTVRTHIRIMYKRLNVNSQTQAVIKYEKIRRASSRLNY